MKALRVMAAWAAITGVSSSALAGDLQASIVKAVQQQTQQGQLVSGRMSKGYLWSGTALFVGGMAVAINGFLNNRNGEFPEFGEAEATDVKMGTAGLAAAFAGGTLLFLGKRNASRAPSITVGPGRIGASSRITW
jgi:hypothetical protein